MRKHFFKQFLNFFWLRPENALLLALRAESYYSTLKYFGNGEGTMDVSCGDGVFSFITLGGELSLNTDMFRAVNISSTFRSGNYDAFDFYDDTYLIEVTKEPSKKYEYGTDWKNNLIQKAARLNFHRKFMVQDNNKRIPLDDQIMNYIYSNSAYWVEQFEFHLRDLSRLTKNGGHVVLQIKTEDIKKYNSTNYLPFMGNRFHEIIDAGRMSTWKGLRSKDEILRTIQKIKELDIIDVQPIYGDVPARIWDIGLRPIFNPLVKMANSLSDTDRAPIKKEWCTIFSELFNDFIESYRADDNSAIEYLIILKKR